MIHPEDLRPGLYVAIRYARAHPLDQDWDHVATPALYRILSVSLPYVALECLASGRRFPADVAAFEFEQVRPEFVAQIHPHLAAAAASPAPTTGSAPEDDRDAQGYPRPVRLMTIRSAGQRAIQ
ncbi:MAG: hypothetical protein PHS14_00315 [Elusimicrobia bacterium]|nr:hypothetical protein [Elusimicrobiota bacterium]